VPALQALARRQVLQPPPALVSPRKLLEVPRRMLPVWLRARRRQRP
jgi:hypothetical protein